MECLKNLFCALECPSKVLEFLVQQRVRTLRFSFRRNPSFDESYICFIEQDNFRRQSTYKNSLRALFRRLPIPKYRRKIAPNKISLIMVEYSRNSSNFVCITFAQYCITIINPLSPKSDQHQISPCSINT